MNDTQHGASLKVPQFILHSIQIINWIPNYWVFHCYNRIKNICWWIHLHQLFLNCTCVSYILLPQKTSSNCVIIKRYYIHGYNKCSLFIAGHIILNKFLNYLMHMFLTHDTQKFIIADTFHRLDQFINCDSKS